MDKIELITPPKPIKEFSDFFAENIRQISTDPKYAIHFRRFPLEWIKQAWDSAAHSAKLERMTIDERMKDWAGE
jgi:hypothetical protein